MTEPIRTQIDDLAADLAARHNILMDKLDELLTDVVAPVDYSSAFASLGDKLDALGVKLSDVYSLQTAQAEAFDNYVLAEIARWNALALEIARLATIDDNVQQIQQTLGLHTGGAEFTLASLTRAIAVGVDDLQTMLAPLASPWPANVLAALECICEAASAQLPIDPLDETQQPEACIAHYQSDGINLFPAVPPITLNALIYATWSEPLPDGLEYGTSTFGELDNGILTTEDWSQWAVFVVSEEPQYGDDPLSPVRYPTNQWRTMSGSGARIFSVSERGSLVVHFCKLDPYAVAVGDCIPLLPNSDHDAHQVFTIPASIPGTFTLSAMDNFYMVNAEWSSSNGPYSAATVYTVATLRATDKIHMYFGAGTSDPDVAITLCNPEPV
jgi:hypothetical protein